MICIGTSGFKFDDWREAFYPSDLGEKEWLGYYARHFNCLEVNASYYKLLHPAVFYQMGRKVPEGFEFTVKAFKGLTHERLGPEAEAEFDLFIDSLRPLQERGMLGCVLAQFPTSFRNTAENRHYLAGFRERFGEVPLVYEFRNREWVAEPVFAFLRERKIGYVCVDEPQFRSLMPPIALATSKIAYVRFHGRNYEKWWKSGEAKERYDYLYSRQELEEWLPKIRRLEQEAEKVYIFMNNCFQAKAARNALDLKGLLGLP